MDPKEQRRCVQVRWTKHGVNIQVDHQTYGELMGALSIAIDVVGKNNLPMEQQRAANLRTLRSELSKG